MDQNQAATKALTMVHKNRKKIQICIPPERVTPCSSISNETCLMNPQKPLPTSGSGSTSFEEGEESFVEMSSAQMEPMDTTESLVTAATNKSHSSGSVTGSALIQMQSTENSPANSAAPQQTSLNPSDFDLTSSSDINGSVNTSTHILSARSSDVVVNARMPSVSTISSSELVGMELSPAVPSGPSFNLPQSKDGLGPVLPIADLSEVGLPGE